VRRDEVVAEYVYLARLSFPLLVEFLNEQAQSFLSLALAHKSPWTKVVPSGRAPTRTIRSRLACA
jgi:hypothetical protein